LSSAISLKVASSASMAFISVSDKTGSMSLLFHEKAEIAVLVPQLFQLKNSFALIMNSHTQEKFFHKELSFWETEREGW